MLQVKECLDGRCGRHHGDRATRDDQTVACTFFGRDARFPTGAMRLADIVRSPVVLFFGLYRGGNRYEMYLEYFSDGVQLSHEQRDTDLKQWTQQYADRVGPSAAARRIIGSTSMNFGTILISWPLPLCALLLAGNVASAAVESSISHGDCSSNGLTVEQVVALPRKGDPPSRLKKRRTHHC